MSFEAVPCRFRSATGPNGETEYIGLLIRPAAENTQKPQQRSKAEVLPPPVSAAPPVSRQSAPPASVGPVRVLATSGTPITVAGENTPRYLVPANVSVTPIPIGTPWPTGVGKVAAVPTVPSTFATPPPNMASPQQPPRSLSVCSSSPMTASSPMSPPAVTQLQQNGSRSREQAPSRAGTWQSSNDSSTTPDSGIQSVPGSPPSHHRDSPPTIEACTSMSEYQLDDEDFADMPRLFPIDQEDEEEDEFCPPGPSGIRDEHSTTGSECETSAPVTFSIHPHMDNAKISEQLIQLDPAKAIEIATEIQKKMGIPVPQTPTAGKKRVTKRDSSEKAKKRRTGSATKEEIKRKDDEEPKQEQEGGLPVITRRMYRETMRKVLVKQLNNMLEKTMEDIQDLHIGERERHGRKSNKGKNKFAIDWEALKKRRKREEDKILQWRKDKTWAEYTAPKVEVKKEEGIVTSPKAKRLERKRKALDTLTKKESPEVKKESPTIKPSRSSMRAPQRRIHTDSSGSVEYGDKKVEMDYEEIPKSVCEENLPGWRVPIIRCACTRGSCSSDAECINRALFVQCPSNCQAPMCINKKFWKEDAVRLLSASGPKSKKTLRTKIARRAGDFLGEFAGEVITFPEAEKRYNEYLEKEETPRILCLSSSLFVDATKKGNICRYVRHSCRPNSRIEVWFINGHLRAGLFPLVDLASNTEVTISMSGLLPVSRNCVSCPPETDLKCCKVIKRSRNAAVSNADTFSSEVLQEIKQTRVFLPRNRRQTIGKARRYFVPKSHSPVSLKKTSFRKILDGLELRIRRVDGSLPYKAVSCFSNLQKAVRLGDQQLFQSAVEALLEKLDDDDLDRVFHALSAHYLTTEAKDTKKKEFRGVREVDLSYLEGVPVGSYNPDEAWPKGSANKRADAVRCECGSLEEDGKMLQCDACNFWLHTDCIGNIDENTKYYQCRLCSGEIADGIPSTDVLLVTQLEVRLEGCVYFKALMNNRNVQVRQFETVYLEKVDSDDHKKILKKLKEVNDRKKSKVDLKQMKAPSPPPKGELKPPGHRRDLRIFRVVRLFVAPGGHRFVFGFYYARPHETICDPTRLFHRNEVFATPLYDTLPLDAVVGRCTVLDPDVWCKGRPIIPEFKEEDVFVCDYQIDKAQRSFEKIPTRHRFPLNTQPYVFTKFDSPRQLVRDFTPFILGERSTSRNSGRLSRFDLFKSSFPSKEQSMKRLESIVNRISQRQPE